MFESNKPPEFDVLPKRPNFEVLEKSPEVAATPEPETKVLPFDKPIELDEPVIQPQPTYVQPTQPMRTAPTRRRWFWWR